MTDLQTYVSAGSEDTDFVGDCEAQALSLVSRFVGEADVPTEIVERACLEVGAELYHRRSARNGITQFATPDSGAGIRIARDPMVAAYPILAPYVGVGIA